MKTKRYESKSNSLITYVKLNKTIIPESYNPPIKSRGESQQERRDKRKKRYGVILQKIKDKEKQKRDKEEFYRTIHGYLMYNKRINGKESSPNAKFEKQVAINQYIEKID